MSEGKDSGAAIGMAGLADPEAMSAGAMLRAAREKRGLHIAALAASIKVSPRKLEALEADRHADLPDMTFTRALAQTVCRALKIDAEPVLARMPQAGDMPRLSQVGGGLNAPFRAAPGNRDPGDFTFYRRPVFWATLAVLAAALALAFMPERWMPWRVAGLLPALKPTPVGTIGATAPVPSAAAVLGATAPSASAPAELGAATLPSETAAAAPTGTVIETVHSAPPPSLAGATAGIVALRTSAESWIDVQDARGQTLLSRNVQPGETVGLDGALPLRLTIGNAAVTQLTFRGQAIDLTANTRDNIARLQLPQR